MRVCYYFVVVLPSCVKHVTEDNDLTLTSLGNWTSGEQFLQRYGATVTLFRFNQKVKHLFQSKIHRWSWTWPKTSGCDIPWPFGRLRSIFQVFCINEVPQPVIVCSMSGYMFSNPVILAKWLFYPRLLPTLIFFW